MVYTVLVSSCKKIGTVPRELALKLKSMLLPVTGLDAAWKQLRCLTLLTTLVVQRKSTSGVVMWFHTVKIRIY